jgi:hypothetical protein
MFLGLLDPQIQIRIHTKMSWIRNTALFTCILPGSDGEGPASDPEEEEKEETKLKRTEQELQKISSGIGERYKEEYFLLLLEFLIM